MPVLLFEKSYTATYDVKTLVEQAAFHDVTQKGKFIYWLTIRLFYDVWKDRLRWKRCFFNTFSHSKPIT